MAPNTLRGGLQKNPEDAPEERHPLPGCEEQLSRKREKKYMTRSSMKRRKKRFLAEVRAAAMKGKVVQFTKKEEMMT